MADIMQSRLSTACGLINKLTAYLERYTPLINAHTTNFFIEDQWNRIVPTSWSDELLNMSDTELASVPSAALYLNKTEHELVSCVNDGTKTGEKVAHRNINCFVMESYEHSLSYLLARDSSVQHDNDVLISSPEQLGRILDVKFRSQTDRIVIGHFMSTKKSYEVDIMAEVCRVLAHRFSIDKVVDVGSGLGYLGAHLALMHNLQVLGIDSVPDRTEAATVRLQRLRKQWRALTLKYVQGLSASAVDTEGTVHFQEHSQQNLVRKNGRREHSQKNLSLQGAAGNGGQIVQNESEEQTLPSTPETSCDQTTSTENHPSIPANICNRYKPVTRFITSNVDLHKLFSEAFDETGEERPTVKESHVSVEPSTDSIGRCSMESECMSCNGQSDELMLTGLHACGDLASSIVRLFASSNHARVLCAVGCCYNLLTDNIETPLHGASCSNSTSIVSDDQAHQECSQIGNSIETKVDNCIDNAENKSTVENNVKAEPATSKRPAGFEVFTSVGERCVDTGVEVEAKGNLVGGFPLSRHLMQKNYVLSRNGKLLSSQAPDRRTFHRELPSHSLYWRAILQVILADHVKKVSVCNDGSQTDNWHVGKLASKCQTFVEYVRKAFTKLKLTASLSDEAIESYLIKYKDDEKKMTAFHQLRSVLAPCIESLILLDRLAFLLEQSGTEQAYIVQLFDLVMSPRCYALIALKKQELPTQKYSEKS